MYWTVEVSRYSAGRFLPVDTYTFDSGDKARDFAAHLQKSYPGHGLRTIVYAKAQDTNQVTPKRRASDRREHA